MNQEIACNRNVDAGFAFFKLFTQCLFSLNLESHWFKAWKLIWMWKRKYELISHFKQFKSARNNWKTITGRINSYKFCVLSGLKALLAPYFNKYSYFQRGGSWTEKRCSHNWQSGHLALWSISLGNKFSTQSEYFRSEKRAGRGNKSIIKKIISWLFVFLAYRICPSVPYAKHKRQSLQPCILNGQQSALDYR